MSNTEIMQQQTEQQQIENLKAEVIRRIDNIESNYVYVGVLLNQLQEKMKEKGILMQWIEKETTISYSTANRYMKVAREYKSREREAVNLGIKKSYLLLKIDDINERFKFIDDYDVKRKTYDEINEILQDYLKQREPDADSKDEIISKVAAKKIKRAIGKSIDDCNAIIDSLGANTPIAIYDVKCKLDEIQVLMENFDNSTEIKDADETIASGPEEHEDQQITS